MAAMPINTYPNSPPPVMASTKIYTPAQSVSSAGVSVSNGQMVGTSSLRRVYASAYPNGYSSGATRSSTTVARTTSYAKTTTPTYTRPTSSSTTTSTTKSSTPSKSPKIAVGPKPSEQPEPDKKKTPVRHPLFRVNRFEDMKVLGYE